jgi:hypothetical protein
MNVSDIKVISFCRGISFPRWEFVFSKKLMERGISHEFKSDNEVYNNEDDSSQIEHGSFHIVENIKTKKFVIFDYGDYAQCSLKFASFKNLERVYLGQYNESYLKKYLSDISTINKFSPGFYPETVWEGSNPYYHDRDYYRLIPKMCFCGSTYGKEREFIKILFQKYPDCIDLIPYRVDYQTYINFYKSHKIALCSTAGFSGGDICLRDIEMFGMGIPIIRTKYIIDLHNSIKQNYIPIEHIVESTRNSIIDHEHAADTIFKQYSILTDDYLRSIELNARNWYERNLLEEGFFNNFYKMISVIL